MPERSLKTLADWYNAQLDEHAMVELDGDLSVLLDNLYPNPFLRDIGPLGQPVGMDVGMPQRIVGHNVYFSDVAPSVVFTANATTDVLTVAEHDFSNNEVIRLTGDALPDPLIEDKAYFVRNPTATTFQLSNTRAGTPINITEAGSGEVVADKPPDVSTLTRQNAAPWPLANPSWVGSQPIITKALRPPTGSRVADLPQAQAPVYDTVPTEHQGYEEGWYGFMWDAQTKDGLRTRPSAMVVFPVGQGQIIEVPVPDSVPEGATHVGLYLTLPAAEKEDVDPSTACLQRVIELKNVRLRVWDLNGPWRAGKLPANKNETMLGVVPAPRGRDIRKRHGRFDLQAGNYMFAVQPVSDIGPGVLSKLSRIRHIQGDRNPDAGGEGGGEEGGGGDEPARLKYQKHQMFTFKPHTWPKGMVGWVPWVWKDGLWYRVHRKRSREGAEDVIRQRSERPEIYGFSDDGYSGAGAPAGTKWTMVQSEPPVEDTSGIEDPDPATEPDAPVAKGPAVPTPGDYWVSITDVTEDGSESPASPPILVHVSSATLPRITFLNSVQLIPNAEGMERDASGLPTHWDVDQSGGSYRWEGGAHILTTTGTVASANTAPSITSENYIPIDQASSYTAKGVLVVSDHTVGDARVVLREYDDAETLLNSFILANASSVGQLEFETTIEPGELNAATTQVKLRAFMPTGSDRNLEMQVSELLLSPGVAPPERVAIQPDGSHEPADFGPPVTTPYPQQAFYAVGAPKPKPGATTNPVPPVEERDFETGTPGTVDWSEITENNGVVELDTSSPISGTQHLKVSNDTTGNKSKAYLQRNYAGEVSGGALAMHFKLRPRKFPTTRKVNNAHCIVAEMRLDEALNEPGAQFLVTNKKKLLLRFYDKNGDFVQRELLSSMNLNGIYDIELLMGGGDSQNGVVSVLIGTGGNQRSEVATVSGQNLTGLNPRLIRLGVSEESHASTTWDFEYDDLVITTTGDATSTNSVPPIGTPEPPDRPLKVPANPWEADQSYVIGDLVAPTTPNNHIYIATTTGTSDLSEPTFPEEANATVTDGGVTWREYGTIYREIDPDGEESYQLVLYLPEETVVSDKLGPRLGHSEDSSGIAVKPGKTYTLSVYSRYQRDPDAEPARPFHITLHDSAGNVVEKGSPYDALAEGGITGVRDWDEDVLTFTVDEGFTELRIDSRAMGEGYYKWQDPLLAEGSYLSQLARDNLRNYNCRVLSVATALIDGRTPQEVNPFSVLLEAGWLSAGIRENEELPTGTPVPFSATAADDTITVINHAFRLGGIVQFSGDTLPTGLEVDTDYYVRDVSLDTFKVSATAGGAALDITADGSGEVFGVARVAKRFRSASDEEGTVWGAWFDEPEDVPQGKWFEAEVTMRSDGRVRPIVPSRGVFLRTRPFTAVVVKADRSAIPGGAFIKGLELPPIRPDWEVVRVGGTTYATDLTEAVMVLPNCELRALSATAKKFLEELAPDDEFIIEAAHAGEDGTGVVMVARAAQVIDFERTGYYHIEDGMRYGYYTIELEAAEVLELAPLE